MYHSPQAQFRPRPEYDGVMRHYGREVRRSLDPTYKEQFVMCAILIAAILLCAAVAS